MGKWLDGWMVVKAVLRIAYSNQKQLSPGRVGRWMGGSKKKFKDCLQQSKQEMWLCL
jgi:hypothetical protein